MRNGWLIGGILLLLPWVVGAAEPEKRTVAATVDEDGTQRVEMIGGGYFFDPYRVIVKVNTPVELTVRKEKGMVPHDLVIRAPEAGIDFEMELAEEPKTVRFTPQKTGTYSIYCGKKLLFFKSHRDRGMEGVLEVVE